MVWFFLYVQQWLFRLFTVWIRSLFRRSVCCFVPTQMPMPQQYTLCIALAPHALFNLHAHDPSKHFTLILPHADSIIRLHSIISKMPCQQTFGLLQPSYNVKPRQVLSIDHGSTRSRGQRLYFSSAELPHFSCINRLRCSLFILKNLRKCYQILLEGKFTKLYATFLS